MFSTIELILYLDNDEILRKSVILRTEKYIKNKTN